MGVAPGYVGLVGVCIYTSRYKREREEIHARLERERELGDEAS